jgi:hypothetical protein
MIKKIPYRIGQSFSIETISSQYQRIFEEMNSFRDSTN